MKIKVRELPYRQVCALPRPRHRRPIRPVWPFRVLLRLLSTPAMVLRRVKFHRFGMEALGKEPCLILMNHSCFLDLKLAVTAFSDRPLQIICTSDGFIGLGWLMRLIGCIPTQKFVPDLTLTRDIAYALRENKSSVLLYPEASYSFDGTATPLPESVGKLVKLLGVPVVTVITHGAFAHDPLYNGLRHRKVDVSADITYLLSPEQIQTMTVGEINDALRQVFSFDNFAWQAENRVRISEPFRATGLNRVLYKCPHCLTEGVMTGEGITLRCSACGKTWELDEYGRLAAGDPVFTHVPDWYAWERECVRREIEEGTYLLETDVDICMVVDYKAVYRVGQGHLHHGVDGFRLTGCGGELDYRQPPTASYGLYADYYWYEIGDMICVGNKDQLYYCFPRGTGDLVAKTRLATEELYRHCRGSAVKNPSRSPRRA